MALIVSEIYTFQNLYLENFGHCYEVHHFLANIKIDIMHFYSRSHHFLDILFKIVIFKIWINNVIRWRMSSSTKVIITHFCTSSRQFQDISYMVYTVQPLYAT